MQIQIDGFNTISDYRNNFHMILNIAPRTCPHCGGILKGHGTRHRWIICADGLFRIPIQRMICKTCRKTVSLLPKILQSGRTCTHNLLLQIKSVWNRGAIKMSAVRHHLYELSPTLLIPVSTLYRWVGHTS